MCVLTSLWLLSSLPVGELLVVYTLLVFIICLFVCFVVPQAGRGGALWPGLRGAGRPVPTGAGAA